MTQHTLLGLPPGYCIRTIQGGKKFCLSYEGKDIGILSDFNELCRFAETDATMRTTAMDEKKMATLADYDVGFSQLIAGTVSILASSEAEALEKLEKMIQESTIGFNEDLANEDGVMSDGSVVISKINAGSVEPITAVKSDRAPEEHSDWVEETENEAEADGDIDDDANVSAEEAGADKAKSEG